MRLQYPQILGKEVAPIKHSSFSKSAIISRFSQRTRNLLVFTAYQCVLEHEESTWRKEGERYERLHPRERLAKHLGVHKSHLSNYFYGRTAIPDDVAERAFALIPDDLKPYFAMEAICSVLIDLAQLFPQYRRPHQFEFFWNLPHLAKSSDGDGMPSCGEVRVRYEFDLCKWEPSVGAVQVTFGADDRGHPRVRIYDKFVEGKQLVMSVREIGSGVEEKCESGMKRAK